MISCQLSTMKIATMMQTIPICPLRMSNFLPNLSMKLPLKVHATSWHKDMPRIRYWDKVLSLSVIY